MDVLYFFLFPLRKAANTSQAHLSPTIPYTFLFYELFPVSVGFTLPLEKFGNGLVLFWASAFLF